MEEVKQEFQLAQARLNELVGEYRRISETIGRKEHEYKMATLTLRELGGMADDTGVYRTVGKAFIKSEKSQVQERLENVSKMAEEEKAKLVSRRASLEEVVEKAQDKAKTLYSKLQS